MIKIKICGITDSFNAREIAEAKPDYMGFIFSRESSRYVEPVQEMTLFNNIPANIKRVGVFLNEDNHTILDLSNRTGLDVVQLHGNESASSCRELRSSGLIIIKAFSIDNDFRFESLNKYIPVCDYFLFDTKSEKAGGSGRKFNWEKLWEYTLDKPFFLSGGIGPGDTETIKSIENRGFYAVDVNSRFETATGIKDVDMVKTFIKEIKNDRL
jgi:phosphoribosylanthranilate isomerase